MIYQITFHKLSQQEEHACLKTVGAIVGIIVIVVSYVILVILVVFAGKWQLDHDVLEKSISLEVASIP